MNPFKFIAKRPFTTFLVTVGLLSGAVFALNKMRAESYPEGQTPKIYVFLDHANEYALKAKAYITSQLESESHEEGEKAHTEPHKIVVTSPKSKDVTTTQEYVCQIRSQRHIDVCALESGFLEKVLVKEGQTVKKGDLLFTILPVLYQARLDAEVAEANLAQLEYNNTVRLHEQNVVSQNEVQLLGAKLAKAKAKAELARAEMNFTNVVAAFDGIVDRLKEREGSLIKEGDILTTLSDNSTMWVYFNVPEADYLEYMAHQKDGRQSQQIELVLANHETFPQSGAIGAIEAKFNNETGNIPFRADFSNPDRLLRHGQTGKVRIHRVMKDSLVLPQRAVFEVLDKRYVFVVDKDDVAHQREVGIDFEMDDIFVLKKGLKADEKVVLEGILQVKDGEKVTAHHEYEPVEKVLAHLKNKAE